MATLSGRCCSMIVPRRLKIIASRRAMGSRGESLMAPQVRQTRVSSWPSSTTPKPVYSVPQSTPSTRMGESLSHFSRFPVVLVGRGRLRTVLPLCRVAVRRGTSPSLHSAASGPARLCDFVLPAKGGIRLPGRCQLPLIQETRIGRFVKNFAQGGQENSESHDFENCHRWRTIRIIFIPAPPRNAWPRTATLLPWLACGRKARAPTPPPTRSGSTPPSRSGLR